jgi:hypothetical protein
MNSPKEYRQSFYQTIKKPKAEKKESNAMDSKYYIEQAKLQY